MQKHKLENGLNIIYYPQDHLHTLVFGLYVNVGSAYETTANNGITHLLEHMHFRRSGRYSQKELYHRTESIGTTLEGKTYKDLLEFIIELNPKFLINGLNFIKSITDMYEWTENDFKKEKQVVANQIIERDSCININSFTDKIVWANHPLAFEIMGTKDTITKLSLSDLINFKKQHFYKGNVTLVVTGNFTKKDIEIINREMGGISLSNPPLLQQPQNVSNMFARKPDIFLKLFEWNCVDVNICFDVDLNNVTKETLILLSSLLGGGYGGVLNLVIREELGLCSDISSYVEIHKNAAVLCISFSAHRNNFYKALSEIFIKLNGLKHDIQDNFIETTMPFFTDNSCFTLDNAKQLNKSIGFDISLDIPIQDLASKNKLYEIVSKKDLISCAKLIFSKENMCVISIGAVEDITEKQIIQATDNYL